MDKRQAEIEKQKPKRIPVGRRQVLKTTGIDNVNFYNRWVNDDGDRLQMFLDGGYEFVQKDGVEVGTPNVDSARGTESVMKKGVGMGMTAYLMHIPIEIWKQDQANKLLEVEALEAEMKKPKDGLRGKIEVEVAK